MIDQDYLIMGQFLIDISDRHNLELGSYRLTFYTDDDMSISFSIVLKNKERLKLENNKLIRLNKYNIIEVGFDFDMESFCYGNFGVTFEEYITYAPKEKLIIMAEALNNVYLSIAKIPTNLL